MKGTIRIIHKMMKLELFCLSR